MDWFVIYTKPRFEIKATQILNSIGIEAYCPTFNSIKQYSDRKKKIKRPMIPSYIFVKVEEKKRKLIFAVPGIIRYLFWLGKPAKVQNKEIDLMKNNLSGIYNEISIKKLNIGSNYNITQGPFKGYMGKVVRLNRNKIKLELPNLGIIVLLKAA